jgi:hypothetical protein
MPGLEPGGGIQAIIFGGGTGLLKNRRCEGAKQLK